MEVPRDIQIEISINQNQLKNAIRNHQILVWKLKEDPNNDDIKLEIQEIHKEIVEIGHVQKNIVERLRKIVQLTYDQQNNVKTAQKPGLEERRFNLANVLNKTRKQAIVSRSASLSPLSPPSDESQVSEPPASEPKTPESIIDEMPLLDVPTQANFLALFGLCTHDVFKELQNKRVERKRRSTANPHFLYGNHWENNKIKRRKNVYLQSNFSPPNTRSSSMRKQKEEMRRMPSPPPIKIESRSASPISMIKKQPIAAAIGLNIPNLPSGLTIERVDSNSNSPELKTCIICHLPGGLSLCDKCDSHFHISCHNRPLTCTPRYCPKCAPKRDRDIGSLREPVSMTVVVGNGVQVTREFKERLEVKKRLQEKNINLNHELNSLKTRHAELTISLKTQEEEKQELLVCERSTKENIQRILDFVKNIKGATSIIPTMATNNSLS